MSKMNRTIGMNTVPGFNGEPGMPSIHSMRYDVPPIGNVSRDMDRMSRHDMDRGMNYPDRVTHMNYGDYRDVDRDLDMRMGYDDKSSVPNRRHMSKKMGGASYFEHEPKDCKEVYAAINARQVTAMMFHSEMADLFGFLNLDGFKDMHEHQFLCESASFRAIRNYFMTHYGKLIPDEEVYPVEIIPDDWYRYKRTEVTAEVRKQAVKAAIEQYLDWEKETKEVYSQMASLLMSWQKTPDFGKVNELVQEVCEEIKRVEHLYLELKSVNYETEHVLAIQPKLSRKYKSQYLGVEDCKL